MKVYYSLIKTSLGEEIFYGVKNNINEKVEELSTNITEVEAFIKFINVYTDVSIIHIKDLFEDFMYDYGKKITY